MEGAQRTTSSLVGKSYFPSPLLSIMLETTTELPPKLLRAQ